jgi:hypothetical protein
MASYHSKEVGSVGEQDFNLNQDRWEKVRNYCDTNVWQELCFAAKAKAVDGLKELTKLREKIQQGIGKANDVLATAKNSSQVASLVIRQSRILYLRRWSLSKLSMTH